MVEGENIELRTSKVEQVVCARLRCSALDVGCWMFILFITQRLHRIHFCRAAGWQPACQQGHSNEMKCFSGEHERVCRFHRGNFSSRWAACQAKLASTAVLNCRSSG